VTALRAVRRLGPLLGRRVLVTGASGGVGRFAVQLAALAGAHVVACAARTAGLAEIGGREVVTDLGEVGEPVDGVIENVGGPLLGQAYGLLAEDGLALSVGQASGRPTTVDFEEERRHGPNGRRIEAFVVGQGLGPDIAVLLDLVARGVLQPQVARREPWERFAELTRDLRERRIAGKAVMEIGS
ncbi:zinc-binding dehydrogenase, partial [Pseudonocardia zijingensis]